ncbi:MAG: hypothetical protein HN402_07995 [Candidatus Scalindua sp.]|jgi:hypothetical protein|nr:hypothetical protein [Candidatus Scalindua sp.]MBT6757798.1 hypothetical protein [Candidatus Jacksonbacteria bacterium]
MELTTETMAHVVVMMDRSTLHITEDEYGKLIELSANPKEKSVTVRGRLINLAAISSIMSLVDYYLDFPNKRPAETEGEYYQAEDRPFWDRQKHASALEGIAKGLGAYIEGPDYKGTNAPKELLANVEKKLVTVNT